MGKLDNNQKNQAKVGEMEGNKKWGVRKQWMKKTIALMRWVQIGFI